VDKYTNFTYENQGFFNFKDGNLFKKRLPSKLQIYL